MDRFVDRQGLGEREHGALGGDVGRGVVLADGGDEARDVDDGAARGAQMRQRQLAEREDADDVELEERAEVVDREAIDRVVGRMPAGIVDETVEATVGRRRPGDEREAIGVAGDVTAERNVRGRAPVP